MWLVERRGDSRQFLKECATREEAEKEKAELIAQDSRYEDVLEILSTGQDERPGDAER